MIVTTVYAKCNAYDRIELWDSLREIASAYSNSWMVGGDFNSMLHPEEKLGGIPLSQAELQDFNLCVGHCGLIDLGFKGSNYTWWNGRCDADCILERLDRVLVNSSVLELFQNLCVEHIDRTGSDHSPLVVSGYVAEDNIAKPFKFLSFWLKQPDFMEVFHKAWDDEYNADPFYNYHSKVRRMRRLLTEWSKSKVGNIFNIIRTLEDIVKIKESLFETHPSAVNRFIMKKAQTELQRFLAMEEEFWRQKSGMEWFRDGDNNSKLFHAYVKGRRRRLRIKHMIINGADTDDQKLISTGFDIGTRTLSQIIVHWWSLEGNQHMKAIYKAVPAIIVWELWRRRNQIKHGTRWTREKCEEQILNTIQKYAISYLHLALPMDWIAAVKILESRNVDFTVTPVYWCKPPFGWIKCNTDGASKGNPGRAAYGFLCRNHFGDLIKAQAGLVGLTTNNCAEAMAILKGLSFCLEKSFRFVEIESDSLLLIKVLNGEWNCPWKLIRCVKLIKDMEINLTVIYKHVHREGNSLADFIANMAFLETHDVHFNSISDLPSAAIGIWKMDKSFLPSFRVRKRTGIG